MSKIEGLPSSKQPDVFNPGLLKDLKPSTPNSRAPADAGLKSEQRPGVTPGSGTNSETAQRPGKKIYTAPASSPEMPSAYIVPRPPSPQIRTGVDKLDLATQKALGGAGWVPLIDNKLEIRCINESIGQRGWPLYEVRGAKSTVKISAPNFAEAAKLAVRFSDSGALAPRTQNIGKSIPHPSESGISSHRSPSAQSRPKAQAPFVPSQNNPIPESGKIDPFSRPIRPGQSYGEGS